MEKLQDIRKKIGFTQIEAAKALNLTRRTYQNHENEYLANDENYSSLVEELKKYMIIDETHGFVTFKQIKSAVNDCVDKYPNIHAVYLFGSYARNEQRCDSDIDLLIVDDVVGLNDVGFALDIKEKLHKNVDVVSYREIIDNENFVKHFLKDSIKLYG